MTDRLFVLQVRLQFRTKLPHFTNMNALVLSVFETNSSMLYQVSTHVGLHRPIAYISQLEEFLVAMTDCQRI